MRKHPACECSGCRHSRVRWHMQATLVEYAHQGWEVPKVRSVARARTTSQWCVGRIAGWILITRCSWFIAHRNVSHHPAQNASELRRQHRGQRCCGRDVGLCLVQGGREGAHAGRGESSILRAAITSRSAKKDRRFEKFCTFASLRDTPHATISTPADLTTT